MASDGSGKITQLLTAAKEGSVDARAELAGLVYGELRKIAGRRMHGERADHVLQPTALVNEAYLKLLAKEGKNWKCRAQFYAVAAQLMRQILIDYARAAKTQKRGGGEIVQVALIAEPVVKWKNTEELLSLDAALRSLEQLDSRQCQIVELKYFAGMTDDEIAEALEISSRTVKRDWNMARLFLKNQMTRPASA